MLDVMIDVETLSTMPNAVIATIAAIKFTRGSREPPVDRFYERIDLRFLDGFHVCNDTLTWIGRQSYDVQNEILGTDGVKRIELKTALTRFKEWIGSEFVYVWSHGSMFDIVILEHAFRKCDIAHPWKFWNVRDTRTIYDVGKIKLDRNSHNAIADCENQIRALQEFFTTS